MHNTKNSHSLLELRMSPGRALAESVPGGAFVAVCYLLNGETNMRLRRIISSLLSRRGASALVAAAVGVGALFAGGPTGGAPLAKRWDRSDNSTHFEYDATRGDIMLATSATRFRPGDPVTFLTYVEERSGAPTGRRLSGVLTLRLNVNRPVVYRGWFGVRILNASGDVVLRRTKWRRISLRPRPGERRARLAFLFDLPSGAYDAVGRFRRS